MIAFWWFPPANEANVGTLRYEIDSKIVAEKTFTFKEWFHLNDEKREKLQNELKEYALREALLDASQSLNVLSNRIEVNKING